jgi:NAD(P)-dependent dehydrogenase (short-subunit alcohol dehydrogenase family)
MSNWQVSDQVVIVTGASKGIGLATAQALLDRGARVALLARDATRLDAAVSAPGSANAFGIAADVCDKAAVERAFDAVEKKWGRIDGLVNNVGFQFSRRIEISPEEEVRRLLDLNLLSAVFACQAAIPRMRRSKGGRIVNVSSASVRNDNEFSHMAFYSASKAALEHFSKELRHEVKADGIMVTVFSPGAVATGSIANFDPVAAGEAMQDWLKKGATFDGMTEAGVIAGAIASCFELPAGVAVEFMEVRPNSVTPKQLEATADTADRAG